MNKLIEINRELRDIPNPKIRNNIFLNIFQALGNISSRKFKRPMGMIETMQRKLSNT